MFCVLFEEPCHEEDEQLLVDVHRTHKVNGRVVQIELKNGRRPMQIKETIMYKCGLTKIKIDATNASEQMYWDKGRRVNEPPTANSGKSRFDTSISSPPCVRICPGHRLFVAFSHCHRRYEQRMPRLSCVQIQGCRRNHWNHLWLMAGATSDIVWSDKNRSKSQRWSQFWINV